MPLCPICHAYYVREPCPSCGYKLEKKENEKKLEERKKGERNPVSSFFLKKKELMLFEYIPNEDRNLDKMLEKEFNCPEKWRIKVRFADLSDELVNIREKIFSNEPRTIHEGAEELVSYIYMKHWAYPYKDMLNVIKKLRASPVPRDKLTAIELAILLLRLLAPINSEELEPFLHRDDECSDYIYDKQLQLTAEVLAPVLQWLLEIKTELTLYDLDTIKIFIRTYKNNIAVPPYNDCEKLYLEFLTIFGENPLPQEE